MTIRLSTDELDIEDEDGEWYHYHGLLPKLRVSENLELFGQNTGNMSIPIETVLPVNVPQLIAEGHDLSAARATLSRWVEGTYYNARRGVLTGRVADPEWGADGEAVAFSIKENAWEDRALIPPSTHVVDGVGWPEVTSLKIEHLGQVYPIVFGRPGALSRELNGNTRVSGSRGVWVDYRATIDPMSHVHKFNLTLVVAGHHVSAQRVYAYTADAPSGTRLLVRNGVDQRGQPVAYIPWYATANDPDVDPYEAEPAGSPYQFNLTDYDGNPTYGLGDNSIDDSFNDSTNQPVVYISWDDEESEDHGGLSRGGELIRSAGDVLEHMLSLTTIPVDRGRCAAAKEALRDFKIDATIDATCSPWMWVRDHLLRILPVTITTGTEGVYPIVWRFDGTLTDHTFYLDTGIDPNIQRSGRVRTDSSHISNNFSLQYAKSRRTGNFVGLARLGAGPYDGDDPDSKVSLHCTVSQQRHRLPDGRPFVADKKLTSHVVYDSATADLILDWMARAYALPRRTIAYVVPEAQWGWMERGMVGQLTDAELHISQQVVMLMDIQTNDNGTLGLVLMIIEDPARD